MGEGKKQGIRSPDWVRAALVRAVIVLLCVLAAWFFTWPVYRAFLNIDIDWNEGWNAYWADAAMGRMPLYPSLNQLITNNYPPLSFYIVGGLGRLVGDPILAGRLLSLLAVTMIAVSIALIIRKLGGSRAGAGIGAVYFVATMSRAFHGYVGMDDPQLLAQSVMAFGFLTFLDATARDRGYTAPILVMVFAGFIKHNIIAIPLAAFVWLAIRRPRQIAKCVALAVVAVVIGFVGCFALFGPDFFANMLCPRSYSLKPALEAVGRLRWVAIGLVAWAYVGWMKRAEPGVQVCSIFIGISLAVFLLQETGSGVDVNAVFDLVIAVSICVGLVFTQAASLPFAHRVGPEVLQFVFVSAICVSLVGVRSFAGLKNLPAVRLVFDPGFRREIAAREKAVAESVARVRATSGDVFCSTFVSYRSGKRFVVDAFSTSERIKAGALPPDAITREVARGKFRVEETDPLTRWY